MKLINEMGEITKYLNKDIFSLFDGATFLKINIDNHSNQIDLLTNEGRFKCTIIKPSKRVLNYFKLIEVIK